MSNRPTWFRFVLGIFVLTLITTSILISQAPLEEPVVLLNSGDTKEEKKLLDELFPYTSRSQTSDPVSSDLITATTYPFATLTPVALEDMSTGTTQLVGPSLDDTVSAVTNIGFDFWYDGVRHAQFSVNPNGLARLGATVIGTTFDNSASGLGTTVNAPKIAPYFE